MSDYVICTPDDRDHDVVCLTKGQYIGLALDAQAGIISILAVAVAFVLIFIKVYRCKKLVQRPMDLFILALFSFDFAMALGRIGNIKWVHNGKVFQGSYCTAQGVIQQFGDGGSAIVTMVITIYTFVVVMWGPFKHQLLAAYLAIGVIFSFVVIFIGVTVGTNTHIMAPDPFWCWIGGNGMQSYRERLAGEYAWIWAALIISVITYVPLSFVALGVLRVSPTHWWKFEVHGRHDAPTDSQKRRSISMITYPIVYLILVTPISFVRWLGGFGSSPKITMPSAATFATEFLFSLSGLANVFIFIFTRKDLFIAANTDGNGQVLPPARAFASDDIKMTTAQSQPQTILPSMNDGGWALPSVLHTSESEEVPSDPYSNAKSVGG